MSVLSPEVQMNYLIQWFKEWSEYQRTDFLPILAEKLHEGAYVNGIVNSIATVNCQDKPMSLFECRVKLFKEWVPAWTVEQRERLAKQIADIDPSFADKLNSEVRNGFGNHTEGSETESTDNQ